MLNMSWGLWNFSFMKLSYKSTEKKVFFAANSIEDEIYEFLWMLCDT